MWPTLATASQEGTCLLQLRANQKVLASFSLKKDEEGEKKCSEVFAGRSRRDRR